MNTPPEDIRQQLSPNESTLWWGRPRQGLLLRGSDVLSIPFSLLWCGFAIFWELSVLRSSNVPVFFVLWGVPFVAVGIYMVIGRFFVEARQRSNTFYAVTPERVLIVSGISGRKVQSLNLKTITDVSLSQGRSNEGSITFGPQNPFTSMFGGMSAWPGAQQKQSPRFDLILDAKAVYGNHSQGTTRCRRRHLAFRSARSHAGSRRFHCHWLWSGHLHVRSHACFPHSSPLSMSRYHPSV